MKAISLRKMIVVVLIIGIATCYAWADKQELQAKLGKELNIEFKDVTIAEALKGIGEKAEVRLVLSDEAVWKLPYAEATRLTVSLRGPLADSLTEMLSAFFMRYAVGDDKITIYPRQELEHILGRPTTKQIELLEMVYTRRLSYVGLPIPEVIPQLFADFNVVIFPVSRYEDFENIANELLLVRSLLPTFAQMLDSLGKWYISGTNLRGTVTEIRIVDEDAFREAKLDQVVDISFKEETADVIIQRLAGWTGMELVVEKDDPSWLDERILVEMQNIKLRQALRNIVNSVNGEISIGPFNEIMITGPLDFLEIPASSKKSQSLGSSSEGYVGKISIPMDGGKYFIEFMLRESDLTEKLKKLREDKIKEILRKVGKAAGDKAPEIAARSQSYSILN